MGAIFIFTLSYLMLLLAASIFAPRLQAVFATERGILRLHFSSFLALAVGLFAFLYFDPGAERGAAVVGALAAHAIVSLSFLELWSLSEGGYSLQMILAIREQAIDRQALIDRFADLGDQKRLTRLSSLTQLGLVRGDERQFHLTASGRVVATALSMLLALVNIKGNA